MTKAPARTGMKYTVPSKGARTLQLRRISSVSLDAGLGVVDLLLGVLQIQRASSGPATASWARSALARARRSLAAATSSAVAAPLCSRRCSAASWRCGGIALGGGLLQLGCGGRAAAAPCLRRAGWRSAPALPSAGSARWQGRRGRASRPAPAATGRPLRGRLPSPALLYRAGQRGVGLKAMDRLDLSVGGDVAGDGLAHRLDHRDADAMRPQLHIGPDRSGESAR